MPPLPLPDPSPATAPTPPRRPGKRRLRSARVVAGLSILLALIIAMHPLLPGSAGTLVATLLPWLGWALPLLALAALLTRRIGAWLFLVAPLIAWSVAVGPVLLPLTGAAGAPAANGRLTVASQNVRGGAGTAAESARALAAEGAEVIALVELDAADREAAAAELADSHPYSYTVGTVGLWSAYPMENAVPLELGLGWRRALSADIRTPGGVVGVYVVHAASVRPGNQRERDVMLDRLGELVPQDLSERLIVLGDFNATSFDPALAPLLSTVSEPPQSTLSWGFTWPAGLPLARIDHIFARDLTAEENRVIAAGDSDHRAVLAVFRLE